MEDPNLANIGRFKPAAPPDAATVVVQSDASATDAHYTGHLRREITEDVQAMLLHVLSWGIAVPNGAVHTVQRLDDPALPMADLVDLHTDLSLALRLIRDGQKRLSSGTGHKKHSKRYEYQRY